MEIVDKKNYRFFPKERNLTAKAKTFVQFIEEFDSHGSAFENIVRTYTENLEGQVIDAIREELLRKEGTQRVGNNDFRWQMGLAPSQYQQIINDMNVQKLYLYYNQKIVPY